MKLLVGLGNPGGEYRDTRHNVGYWLVDQVASSYGIDLSSVECWAKVGRGAVFGIPAVLAEPLTFMNRSGWAVRCLLERYGLMAADLVVSHDDLDIPVGRFRVKRAGGDAGHRGVHSIIEELGTGEFTRLRIGIGRPSEGEDATTYVLSPFTEVERGEVRRAIEEAIDELEVLLAGSELASGTDRSR